VEITTGRPLANITNSENKKNLLKKSMKYFITAACVALALFQISCKGGGQQKSEQEMAQMKADSMHRADSMQKAAADMKMREDYRASINKQMDTLKMQMDKMDSMASKKKEKDKKMWEAKRDAMKARMDSLKKESDAAGSATGDKWNMWKMKMDSSMMKMKSEWNNMTTSSESKEKGKKK
jgi:hypothetical protein